MNASVSLAIIILSFALAWSASAQTPDPRVERIERDLSALQRTVYRGEAPPSTIGGDVDDTAFAELTNRVGDLEAALQNLTSQLEETQRDIFELNKKLEAGTAASAVPPMAVNNGISAPAPLGLPQAMPVTTSTASPSTNDPVAAYEQAFATLRQGDYGQASGQFAGFLQQFPDHHLAANAQYWLAETYYVQKDYPRAVEAFLKGYQTYPKATKAPDSLLKLALSLSSINKRDDACRSLARFHTEYPAAAPALKSRAEQEQQKLSCTS